jgi:hypothetical protein
MISKPAPKMIKYKALNYHRLSSLLIGGMWVNAGLGMLKVQKIRALGES